MDWWPDLAYRISGVWAFGPKLQFQLWWASQEKMCPSGTSQSQLVDPGQRGKMELVPSSCWNYVYSKDLFSPFHSSQHRLLCFYHHSVRQRNKYKWTFEFKSFLVGSLMASPIVHNWTLLFLSFVWDVRLTRNLKFCDLCLVPLLSERFWDIWGLGHLCL
jgi:hypothetical protein